MCQHLRRSVISTPQNWTVKSSNRKILATLSLERAKVAAPLEIHLDIYEIREDTQFLDLPKPYAQNAESLRVTNLLTTKDLASLSQHPISDRCHSRTTEGRVGPID